MEPLSHWQIDSHQETAGNPSQALTSKTIPSYRQESPTCGTTEGLVRRSQNRPRGGGGWSKPPQNQQMNNQPIFAMLNYQSYIFQPRQVSTATPPLTGTSLTEVSSLTEIDRQLIQIKKDMAELTAR